MSKRYRVTVEGELDPVSTGAPFVGQKAHCSGVTAGGAERWWTHPETTITAVEELPELRTTEQERDAAIAALREIMGTARFRDYATFRAIAAKHGVPL